MAAELTTESYISHHLTNLTCGKTPSGWTCDPYKVEQMGFWANSLIFGKIVNEIKGKFDLNLRIKKKNIECHSLNTAI